MKKKKNIKSKKTNNFYINFIIWDSEFQKHCECCDMILLGNEKEIAYQLGDFKYLNKIRMPEKFYFKQFKLLPIY